MNALSELNNDENEQDNLFQEQYASTTKKRGRKKVEGNITRKRMRNTNSWAREIRKKRRNAGLEYKTATGKTVKAKGLKAACTCRLKCFEKFSEIERQTIFADYYSLSKEAKNQFIAGLVCEKGKARQRLRDGRELESRRKFTRLYSLPKSGEHIAVCQKMFLNTLDVTLKKVRVVTEKKRKSNSGMCAEDLRGKHGNQLKVSQEARKIILDHIQMFPAIESHYSRSHTARKYLSPDLSISKMYKLYVDFCTENNIIPQSRSFYRQMFVENFNYQFKKPKNDTCAKCDKFDMIIKSTDQEEERINAEKLKNEHLDFAEAAYKQKDIDKKLSLKDKKLAVVSFDLQKCLATPSLVNGVSFYKRQLWTYNLTLYETRCNQANPKRKLCFIWDETIAKRGSQEIASCLMKYLNNVLDKEVSEVIFYSDCCPGQTRNIFVSAMFLYVVQKRHEEGHPLVIHHKFLEPGHTHMEADTIHALIERAKKRAVDPIEIPRDWVTFIRYIQCDPNLIVFEMEQREFFDFKSLMKNTFIHRTENTEAETVYWNSVRWVKYAFNEDSHGKLLYKTTLQDNVPFKVLDISRKKGKRHGSKNQASLQPISNQPLPLSKEKLNDLKSLMPFISNSGRMYYATFVNSLACTSDGDDDTDCEFEDEEN